MRLRAPTRPRHCRAAGPPRPRRRWASPGPGGAGVPTHMRRDQVIPTTAPPGTWTLWRLGCCPRALGAKRTRTRTRWPEPGDNDQHFSSHPQVSLQDILVKSAPGASWGSLTRRQWQPLSLPWSKENLSKTWLGQSSSFLLQIQWFLKSVLVRNRIWKQYLTRTEGNRYLKREVLQIASDTLMLLKAHLSFSKIQSKSH